MTKPHPRYRRLLSSIEPIENPARDRKVPARKVACPACGAQPGEPCIGSAGEPVKINHRDRRRRALREGL